MGRTRIRRREREEELPPVEEIEASPEEVELSDFLDGLGPQGISEVSLYRVTFKNKNGQVGMALRRSNHPSAIRLRLKDDVFRKPPTVELRHVNA